MFLLYTPPQKKRKEKFKTTKIKQNFWRLSKSPGIVSLLKTI